jgi:hypothetical protein
MPPGASIATNLAGLFTCLASVAQKAKKSRSSLKTIIIASSFVFAVSGYREYLIQIENTFKNTQMR